MLIRVAAALALTGAPVVAAPQLRVSPGPLAGVHASLEGVTNCGKCHDSAQALAVRRCLACHKPIAERMAARRGVHRAVTGHCGKCHAEHAGAEADLRRIDRQAFDHALETGFALEGEHARLSTCGACHKKRSFLGLRSGCGSCHADPHKASLGPDCTRCHSTAVPFKHTRRQFDHSRARFELTGAHRQVACEKCHVSGVFRGLRFDACSACHPVPHRRTLGPACTSCHVTDKWGTRSVDHGKTGFVLAGAHLQVACARCHVGGVRKVLHFDRCSACHENVHRNSVREDCGKCHTPASFRGATFDHAARTRFPLTGKHEGLTCRKCHTRIEPDGAARPSKSVDFGGLRAECSTCHKDQHKGEYGVTCDACHRTATFKAAGFSHPRAPQFFAGRHAGLPCVKCHTPASAASQAKTPSMACNACHTDVHLGQLGPACERCHGNDAPKFAPSKFSHDGGAFPLTGKHRAQACARCHAVEKAAFPGGNGTARRFAPVSRDCASCHKDPHLGQVDLRCATCHSAETFKVTSYLHRGLESLFAVATHDRLACRSCHKVETAQFPAGQGTTMRLKVGRACLDCHP